MTALYLGTGKLEKYLVNKLNTKVKTNEQLKLTLLLDYMRGTRIGRDGTSSLQMLKPLKLDNFNRPIRVGFYHNPDTGLFKGKFSNSPLREIFGVHHMKAHVFDNNILITGANLSEDYFTDRQDRCIVIQDCEPLADWYHELIQVLSDCSLQMNDSGDLAMLPHYVEPWKKPAKFKQ
jgi:CDP-diacylglycerol--glycerol-3-phosphate 3-phosphatidyltransferase